MASEAAVQDTPNEQDSPGLAPGTPESHAGTASTTGEVPHETWLGLDSYGWVALAFLVFAAILWRLGAFRMLGTALDKQADKVKSDLAEAATLRAEAEAMKAQAAADAAQSQADARAMLANAEAEAQRIVEQSGHDAEAAIARRTRLAQDRIAAETRAAEAALRARAADITVKAAETILAARQDSLQPLTDAAIAGLDRR